ncbi:MAG: hypothetical protein HZB70_01175 [Candidatus Berkelbacteria bacterium]|nr:MAG: hypothetical protein HZB70_01175 [Candidatus Berkelbacteria bacterium]QQG52049.1 MAG: hypothetical protein HY845_01820 [Candidatus Berkelbacteria bacterium]
MFESFISWLLQAWLTAAFELHTFKCEQCLNVEMGLTAPDSLCQRGKELKAAIGAEETNCGQPN